MMRTLYLLLFWAALSPGDIVEKASAMFDENRYRETVDLINEALPALRQSGDVDNLAECLSLLSISYFRLGAFSSAWDAQNECYQLDLASGDPGNISSSLNTMAAICLAMENYDEGERLIREAIRYEEPLGNTAALAIRYGMAADILLKQGKIEEAVTFASRALEMDKAAGRPVQAAVRQSQLAAAYTEAGRLVEAGQLLDAAAATFSKADDFHSLMVCRHQQGIVAAKRGSFWQAAQYLREGLTLSRQTGELLQQRNISQDLAVLLKDADPRASVGYLQDVVALSDSIYRQEMARKMAELTIKNDLDRKEQEILTQEQTLKARTHQIVLLSGLLVLVLLLAAVLLHLYLIHRRDNERLKRVSAIKDKLLMLGESPNPENAKEISRLARELTDAGEEPATSLTAREREIARLCCEGLASKEIADRLTLSPRTVETHKNNIFKKLGVSSTAELVELLGKLKQ